MTDDNKNIQQEIEKAAQAAVDNAVRQQLAVRDEGPFAYLMDTAKFNHLWRVSAAFAKSDMIPAHYQGKPENCMIAMQMATRLNVDPFMFMQNTYIVNGRPGMEAKLAIALINMRGPFDGPIQYKFEGEGTERSCTAYAVHKRTRETCKATVTWTMVAAEGWNKKAGSKWLTMPDLMFQYRSAMFLGRLYAPECLMGMQTVDELQDVGAIHVEAREITAYEEPEKPKEQAGDRTEGVKAKIKSKRNKSKDVTEPLPQSPEMPPLTARQMFLDSLSAKCSDAGVKAEWQDDTLVNDVVIFLSQEKLIMDSLRDAGLQLPEGELTEDDERWYALEATFNLINVPSVVKKAIHFREGNLKF